MQTKWTPGGLKTPLSRAKGLGSAKDGLHHWIMQRMTAISNIILTQWFVWSVVCMADKSYVEIIGWLNAPVNAVLMILFVMSVFYHAMLGLQVVIEDYIPSEGSKIAKLVAVKLFYFALAVACVFFVLKIAL